MASGALLSVPAQPLSRECSKKFIQLLPSEFLALHVRQLIDFKVDAVTIVGREFVLVNVTTPSGGPDDGYYEKNAELRKLLPRGLCFVVYQNMIVKVVAGMPKFGYKEMKCYRKDDEDSFEVELYTVKENGQCARISGFYLKIEGNTTPYLLIGSKKVVSIVRADHVLEDLQLYTSVEKNNRHLVCIAIGKQLVNECGNDLSSFPSLIDPAFTLVAESCRSDDQHITVYDKDQLFCFGVVTYDIETGAEVMDPRRAPLIAARIGLPFVKFEKAENEASSNQLAKKANNDNKTEGAVVYRIVNGEVVWIYKVKSNYYSIKRSAREMMKRRVATPKLAEHLRMKWMIFTGQDDIPGELLQELLQFNAWCHQTYMHDDPEQAKNMWSELFTQFVDAWLAFYKQSADQRQACLMKFDEEGVKMLDTDEQQLEPTSTQLQLVAVGLSGSGKTTLGKQLMELLKGTYCDQDECGGRANMYHDRVGCMTSNNNTTPVFLGKIHHNDQLRHNVLKSIGELGYVVYVVFIHKDDKPGSYNKLLQVCTARATARVGHAMLSQEDAPSVIRSQANDLTLPMGENVIQVDIMHSLDEQVKHVLSELGRIKTYFENGGKIVMRVPIVYPLYTSIVLDAASANALRTHPLVVAKMPHGFIPTKDTHVTILYQGGKPHSEQQRLAGLMNKVIELEATHLAYDQGAIAAVVSRDNYWSSIETTHITLGTHKNKKPSWSSTMLKTAEHHSLEVPIKLKGVVQIVYAGREPNQGGASSCSSSSALLSGKVKGKISHSLSKILRHGLQLKRDLELFSDLEMAAKQVGVSSTDIRTFLVMQAPDEKKRFEIVGDKIRAFQGHSAMVLEKVAREYGVTVQDVMDNVLVPISQANLAEVAKKRDGVFMVRHMTNPEAAVKIKANGLSRMQRAHIHMIKENGCEDKVYQHRIGATVPVWVKLDEAMQQGISFGYSTNGCVLSPGNHQGIIPVELLVFE